ncbi:hypothetical protein B0I35DRAFT_2207 [Stachybotrys elegans]|uniref:Uncharacterized protein n=1 Tax=Stachybotrys elegans TaxID=80388 RepID=A0A8K0SZM3_9HYPO|nr:hypothetical protein B0I35DRAFT_2207 [Stachybotrys elegans]
MGEGEGEGVPEVQEIGLEHGHLTWNMLGWVAGMSWHRDGTETPSLDKPGKRHPPRVHTNRPSIWQRWTGASVHDTRYHDRNSPTVMNAHVNIPQDFERQARRVKCDRIDMNPASPSLPLSGVAQFRIDGHCCLAHKTKKTTVPGIKEQLVPCIDDCRVSTTVLPMDVCTASGCAVRSHACTSGTVLTKSWWPPYLKQLVARSPCGEGRRAMRRMQFRILSLWAKVVDDGVLLQWTSLCHGRN